MKNKKIAPICPKCYSKTIVARIKTNEHYCRRCGYIGGKKEFYERKGEKDETSSQE